MKGDEGIMQEEIGMSQRAVGFIVIMLIGLVGVHSQLYSLWELSFGHSQASELYSYMPAIPFISAFFFWLNRKSIFEEFYSSALGGAILLAVAAIIYILGTSIASTEIHDNELSWAMLSLVIWLMGGFVCFYGFHAFKKAIFPLCFLGFMIPIPSFILDPYIRILQRFSAEVSFVAFKSIGVPIFRDGMVFNLPGLSIEVAKQCSGIRSSLALIIFTVICGYIFLKRNVSRLILLAFVVPIAVVKNGLRIVILGLLGAYVDKTYITNHWLHRSGGIVFFIAGLLVMFLPVLWSLRTLEKKTII